MEWVEALQLGTILTLLAMVIGLVLRAGRVDGDIEELRQTIGAGYVPPRIAPYTGESPEEPAGRVVGGYKPNCQCGHSHTKHDNAQQWCTAVLDDGRRCPCLVYREIEGSDPNASDSQV